MILYLDASALVKLYTNEPGTTEVTTIVTSADAMGTTIISRAETVAAFAKAVRTGALEQNEAISATRRFRSEWPALVRIRVGEPLVALADALAWEFGLRGYDAVHLASALQWQDNVGEKITFATFDRQLWEAGRQRDLVPFPEDLPGMLATWREAT